jgi:hypothetical protein
MIGLFLLVVREGFLMDIILPGVVGGAVLIWMGNSILKKFGYYLW